MKQEGLITWPYKLILPYPFLFLWPYPSVATLVPFTVVWTDGQEQTDIKKGETSLGDQANSFVLDKSKARHW